MDLFHKKKEFKEQVVNRLKTAKAIHAERLSFIDDKRKQGERYSASGVLIPLEFDRQREEWVMIVTKRSDYVQQPADLCFPGGGMGQRADRIWRFFLTLGFSPAWRATLKRLREFPSTERKAVSLIFSTSLRESWEEMRLPPWKVEFMGALPVYTLLDFTRSIFPVVGMIKGDWPARPNWEVEKVIRVPVRSFFEAENYIRYVLTNAGRPGTYGGKGGYDAPAFAVPGSKDEDILWGATFSIVMDFFRVTLGLPCYTHPENRVVVRELPEYYYAGRKRNKA